MGSNTSSGASGQGTGSYTNIPSYSSSSASSTTGPITQAPAAAPVMQMPRPDRPALRIDTGANADTHAMRTSRVPTNFQFVDHDRPAPLGARVLGGVKEAGSRAYNCCLGCTCHVCCGT